MQPKNIARDTAKVVQSYLTYQAVKTIVDQLSETNPTLAIWLSNYSSTNSIQNGEAYLEGLMEANKELFLRVLTVREHLAQTILEFIPEMVNASISKSNMEHRRCLLERLTQSQTTELEDSQTDTAAEQNSNE
jgi:hypothetical protein